MVLDKFGLNRLKVLVNQVNEPSSFERLVWLLLKFVYIPNRDGIFSAKSLKDFNAPMTLEKYIGILT